MLNRVSIGLATVALLALVAGTVAGACLGSGNGRDPFEPRPTLGSSETETPATATAVLTPAEDPTELRVAFISLLSPVPLDETNMVPADTLEARINLLVEELRAYDPDILGIANATVTQHGRVATTIAQQLGMEPFYQMANPWPPGTPYEDAKAFADENRLDQDGIAILVRSDRYPVAEGSVDLRRVNPRWTANETQPMLRVIVSGPAGVGNISVYLTNFIGSGDERHALQAQSFLQFVESTRGENPAIVMGDFNESPGSLTYETLTSSNTLVDPAPAPGGGELPGTCCRDTVLVPEPLEPLTVRTSFIFTLLGWLPAETAVFAGEPGEQPNGGYLYASDHNGVYARFEVRGAVEPTPAGP